MQDLYPVLRRLVLSAGRSRRRRIGSWAGCQALEQRCLLAGTITGRVWVDSDYDGQQDASETQNANVTVSLVSSGNVLRQSTTVNGIYTLTNVPTDSSYDVKFSLPQSFTLGPRNSGNDATDNDFDVNSTYGATEAYVIFARVNEGQTLDLDAGIVQGANLTVFSWNDADGDGIQDAGAPESTGLSAVTVTLKETGNAFYAQAAQTTAGSGIVTFNNVRPGTFSLGFTHPTLVRTAMNQGANENVDSDADPVSGNTANFSLTPAQARTDIDAGFRDPNLVTGKITGRAWLDNADGIRQAGETALTGIHVIELYRSTDAVVGNADDQLAGSAATNAQQNYQLTGLAPGNYYVRSVVPTNHVITPANQGNNDTVDSDFQPATRNSGLLVVAAGATIANVDVGFVAGTGAIGNFVWNDTDRDGIQDLTETGLAGAVVKLFNTANAQVGAAITTTVTGSYLFSGLQPGQYYVRVTPPRGYIPTLKDQGVDDAKDSDIDRITTSTALITLAAGSTRTQWDAGMYRGARIGDKVWIDNDRDGQQDVGEPGKQGVNVRLKSAGADTVLGTADDTQVAQTGTNTAGVYEFVGVPDGAYYVEFVAPTGFLFTARDVGSDLSDSDAGLTNGRTARFKILNLADNLTLDAGLVPEAAIEVHVWDDEPGKGVYIPGENAPNIEVCVYDPRGGIPGDDDDVLVVRGRTGIDGKIRFPRLRPGVYYIRVTLPGGCQFSPPGKTTNEATDSDVIFFCSGYGNTATFTVSPGGTSTITAGLVPLRGAIEGLVWNDANRNKVRDGGLLQSTQPDIVIAIDISGSTTEPFAGTTVGDVNGDGFTGTILDAELYAAISLVQQLNDAGYGSTARIGVVTFSGLATKLDMNGSLPNNLVFSTPNADTNQDHVLDVVAALKGVRSGGATNYQAALQEAINTFNVMATPNGRGTLLFFSDGAPTQGGVLTSAIATLSGKKVNMRAYGMGHGVSLAQLQLIDRNARTYSDTDDFLAQIYLNNISGYAAERGMPGVAVYLDKNNNGVWDGVAEPKVTARDDDPDTDRIDESGIYRFGAMLPGEYIVREILPAGYIQTHPGSPGFGWLVTVTAGRTSLNGDFGNAANPTLSGLPASLTYTAGAASRVLASTAVIGDADTPVMNGGTLDIRVSGNGQSSDRLFILHQGSLAGQIGVSGSNIAFGGIVIGTFSGGTGTTALLIQFNSKATLAAVQALARRISYRNTLTVPPVITRTIQWKLTDGVGGGSIIKLQTMTPVL